MLVQIFISKAPVFEKPCRRHRSLMDSPASATHSGEDVGYLKMPYQDTRYFTHMEKQPECYYPRDPREYAKRVSLDDIT